MSFSGRKPFSKFGSTQLFITFILFAGANRLAAQLFLPASTNSVGLGPAAVVAADVNADGRVDLITANHGTNTLSVLLNAGGGVFVWNSTLAVGTNPVAVAAADLNGDGKIDLVSVNYGDSSMTVLTNNGVGGFATAATLAVGSQPQALAVADLNNDAKPDLICANYGSSTLTVLTNNGQGGFVTASSPGTGSGTGPFAVAVADVNGDGKPDLISANYNTGTLTVLTNKGGGNFAIASTTATLGAGAHPLSLVAADITGNGVMAMVCANFGSNTLSVLTNNGAAKFILAATLKVGKEPAIVAAADVNRDGKLDLICANSGTNTLTVLTNNGAGVFGLAQTPVVGYGPDGLAVADLYGTGQPDLASANYNDNTLIVLTNTLHFTPPPLNVVAVGGQVIVLYPTSAVPFVLQTTTNLVSGPWVTVSNGVPVTALAFTNISPAAFFRLQ